MSNPILTIGIPTYNRPQNIVKTVRTLLPQLNERVKLVVHDNCSDTPVADLFTDDEKKLFYIRRNNVNIGGDANIAGVIYHADTKWVWDLGDDDYPLEDAINTILKYIDKYPDTLMFNFNSYLERVTESFEELVNLCKYRYVYANFVYISSGIYNRDKLADYLFYYFKNLSAMVGQTIFVLKYLEKNDDICRFVKRKIVYHSVDNFDNNQDEVNNNKIKEGVGWSRASFVRRSSLIFEEFADKRNELNSTLFKGITLIYLRALFEEKRPFKKNISLFFFIVHTVGLYNLIRYNSFVIGQFLAKAIFPDCMYQKMKNRAKKAIINSSYNEK